MFINTPPPGARALVNGRLLTVRQTEKFHFYMEHSPRFRERFAQLSIMPDPSEV